MNQHFAFLKKIVFLFLKKKMFFWEMFFSKNFLSKFPKFLRPQKNCQIFFEIFRKNISQKNIVFSKKEK